MPVGYFGFMLLPLARGIVVVAALVVTARSSWAEPGAKSVKTSSLPRVLIVSDPVLYDVVMTTSFTIPAGERGIRKMNVWHAIPALRPWSNVPGPAGASLVKSSGGGQQQYD